MRARDEEGEEGGEGRDLVGGFEERGEAREGAGGARGLGEALEKGDAWEGRKGGGTDAEEERPRR